MGKRKCAIVTGASTNIGQGIAILLAERGYDLAVTYSQNIAGAKKTQAACEAFGARCYIYQAFLNEPDAPARVIDQAYADLGQIDAMICNAGHGGGGSVIASDEKEIDDVYSLDYRGYMLCAGAAARHMIHDGIKGNIIFISSSQGQQAYPGNFIYCGMKAAINHSCSCMALDLSHYGIRVNVVAPGQVKSVTDTPSPRKVEAAKTNPGMAAILSRSMDSWNAMPFTSQSVPAHRMGEPRDIAGAVAYLISDEASFITGIVLRVDGGLILPGLLEGYDAIPWAGDNFWNNAYKKVFGEELVEPMMAHELTAQRKSALVTCAESGAGQGIAVALAKDGYDVAITYSNDLKGAGETKRAIELLGRRCCVYQASLQEPGRIQAVVDTAHEDMGRLDVMVNNTGLGYRTSVINATAENIDSVYAQDYRAYMMGAGAAARHMIKDNIKGSIIFVTSTRGTRAYPDDFIYCGLKAGVEHSARCIALDLSHYGIRVNCVAPGAPLSDEFRPFVEKSVPLHRVGNGQDCGEVVAFLVSERASYITGTSVHVDGGVCLPGLLEGNDAIPWCAPGFWDQQYKLAFGESSSQA